MIVKTSPRILPLACLALSLVLSACNSDTRSDTDSQIDSQDIIQSVDSSDVIGGNQTDSGDVVGSNNQTDGADVVDSNNQTDSGAVVDSNNQTDSVDPSVDNDNGNDEITGNSNSATPPVTTDDFSVSIDSSTIDIIEGNGEIELPVTVSRAAGFTDELTLTVTAATIADADALTQSFSDGTLDAGEQSTTLQLELDLSAAPIQPQTRSLLIIATDTSGQSSTAALTLQVQPTSAPDVYLLIGQSNMVGISEEDAKQSQPGEPDAPEDNIRQLNVTFNDVDNFSTARDFTDPEKLYNNGEPLTIALDPLHSGLQSDNTKSGTRIGMGLSFAKSAAQDTTADIYLVPAAWSDTGFCKRDTNVVEGIGWNATEKDNDALSGTLLHDRAIARVNDTLEQTNGILRGILWHQGEADSDDEACAIVYSDNLVEMIESLRTNIQIDARGSSARGPDADIPFIAGTMSKAGTQAPFSTTKLIVDGAIRSVGSNVAFADFVNGDDLVPPSFACGGGSCIHFGADALRELGARYYLQLRSVLP